MASLLPGFEYDIFISYRHKDNKGERWVTEFVNALKAELEATFKEDISIYFDENPHDGLHEHHDVDDSLKDKLKCLVFLPILSRTYCDPKSFAFEHEFKAFVAQAAQDSLGLKLKLSGGNVASRLLPIRIHELSKEDVGQFEAVTGSVLRSIDFVYRETGVNRPLKPADQRSENLNRSDYRNQVNKVANAISEILATVRSPAVSTEESPSLPTESRPAEVVQRPSPPWAHAITLLRRVRISPVVVLTAALAISLGALLLVYRQWQMERVHLTEYIPVEFKDPYRERSNWGATSWLSNNGRTIVFRARATWYFYDLASGKAAPTAKGTPYANHFEFSPDDEYGVIRGGGIMGQLHVVSLSTGQHKLIADSASGHRPRWSKSGWIYYLDLQGNIARVDANGKKQEVVLKRETPWNILGRIEILGSDAILYARRKYDSVDPAQAELVIHDLNTRTSHPLCRAVGAAYDDRNDVLIVAQAGGALLATRCDPKSHKPTREFVKVLEGVETWKERIGATFSLSRNGDLLYVTKDEISKDEIVWMNRKGTEARNRTTLNGWTEVGIGLGLSTDGKMLLVPVSRDNGTAPNVWLKNLSDGSEQKVSFGDVLDYSPAFVSAGAAITFVSPRDYQNWDLYRQPLDGKSALEKILDRPGDIHDPDFSPGEQSVAFTERDIKGQSDVRVHHFGPEPRTEEVWASSANEFGARFSPDGNFIAFVSDETGRPEVYVVPYPNPNKLRRPISTEGGGAPAWSRRGDELFYRTPDDDLVAVQVNTQGAFSQGKPERLFNLNKMQWTTKLTPDGSNFILIHQDMRAPGQVILVKNWMQEVLRKLEGK